MSFLISTTNGSIQAIEISNKAPFVQYGKEICQGDSNVTSIKRVQIKGHHYLILLRCNNALEVYKLNNVSSGSSNEYQKVKQWKNCLLQNHSDSIVDMGMLLSQYLYVCSFEGKLVLIDLVNDDYDGSFKSYKIHGPVTGLKVVCDKDHKQLVVLVGNKEGALRSYEINMDKEYAVEESDVDQNLFDIRTGRPVNGTVDILANYPNSYNNIQNVTQIRSLLRRRSNTFAKEKLVPNFEAAKEVASNGSTMWIVSIEMNHRFIVTGTAFGYIVVYDKTTKEAIKSISVSRFSIVKMVILGNKLIYTDLIYNIGVLNLTTFNIDHMSFKFGVIEQNCILYRKSDHKFRVVACNVDRELMIVEANPLLKTVDSICRVKVDNLHSCFVVVK